MMMTSCKLITFDVTGTLLKFRSPPPKIYGEIGAVYGIESDSDTLSVNFKRQWRRMNKEHPNFGLHTGIGWENWWKDIVKGTFDDYKHEQIDLIAKHLINAFRTSACWQHCYGALNLLSSIRSKGIPMGIISNFDPRLHDVVASMKLNHFFKFVVTSYEVGVEKPDKRIFEKAMEFSKIQNLKSDECLHIGDNIYLDYCGATNCGWQAILIDNKSNNIEDLSAIKKDHLFTNLFELHKYFIQTSGDSLSNQIL